MAAAAAPKTSHRRCDRGQRRRRRLQSAPTRTPVPKYKKFLLDKNDTTIHDIEDGVKDGGGGGTQDLPSRMRSRTETAAAAPEHSHADGVKDSGGCGCRFRALPSRMGSRIVTAVGAPEPSRVDGVEDGYSRTSCPRRQRQRQLPSLPPRIGPTIAVTTVAPEAFTEVVDDGGSVSGDGGGRRQRWRERKGREKRGGR
uniref:Uncharacterized protein n=1 Tax=Oryza rufipogon TaxID=4529 RepID=A0A0E0R8B2_ORYRU